MVLEGEGYTVDEASSGEEALARLPDVAPDVILLDVQLPNISGHEVLESMRKARAQEEEGAKAQPEPMVIMISGHGTLADAVRATKAGAYDFLEKPLDRERLIVTLRNALERRAMVREVAGLRAIAEGRFEMVGQSPAMAALYAQIAKVAPTRTRVLITGESGTGKELVARAIHRESSLRDKPFIKVNCAAISPELIESELFGHERGAFTGAAARKKGLFELADGGTIFLDEIGELPLDLQGRLLRALQDKEVRPIGSSQSIPISVRVLAATSRDLTSMVETGRFRKDLFFRLNIVNLRIPALRERKADIPLLAAHVLDRMHTDNGLAYTFADNALQLLMEYDWPGNVRELENAIERACALSSGPVLHLGDFPTQMQNFQFHAQQSVQHYKAPHTAGELSTISGSAEPNAVQSIAELEKQAILTTIAQLNGDKLMAARLLGIGKTTLYRKLKEYGLGDDSSLM
jgi:two-component system response regulator HydG